MSERIFGVILFACPGRMPASLRVLLKSLFPLMQIKQTETLSVVKGLLAVEQSWLVLIDADLLENEGWNFLNGIMQEYPRHRFLFLAHHARQKDQVLLAGLPTLLLEGMTGESLAEAIGPFFQNNVP